MALCLLLVGGCSRTTVLYRNLDWFLEQYAIKTLDATPDQLEAWRPVLASVLDRHVQQELPLLEGYFALLAQAMGSESPADFDGACLVAEANRIYARHARLAAELAVPLLESLTPGQLDHLSDYLVERRNFFHDRYLRGDETAQRVARTARLVDRFEGWTGPLNVTQRIGVEQFAARLSSVPGDWLKFRERQEARLLQLLWRGAGREAVHAQLIRWWVPWSSEKSEFFVQWQFAEDALARLLDHLAASLTDRQRERVTERAKFLISELSALRPGQPGVAEETWRQFRCIERPA